MNSMFSYFNKFFPNNFSDRLLDEETFVVLDTETTGLDVKKGDRIISLGAVKVKNNIIDPKNIYDQLVDPKRDIPENSSKIHGLFQKDILGKPAIQDIEHTLAAFIGNSSIVGHHIDFDYAFIKRAVPNGELKLKFKLNPVIDTLSLSIALCPDIGSYELSELCQHFDISEKNRHTALGDSLMTAQLLVKLIAEAKNQGYKNSNDLLKLMKRSSHIQKLLTKNAHY